ncbi:Splicing regulatory glutamine/lysine-rich protein 1-like [Oopsacas minuta]|uniref:Splicing regulatory glutamine/lysine-rich protein 1-like n=1 Tax=Oopsacas minuta TaxID=111878 RepID=A0AAV7KI57_9METZ|nr:Splicing regulatory glutamine/lysine-rich protein 1-like [Oopsacas minuta]
MSSSREIETNNCCIIQVTNISPSCTSLQVETLFSLLGHIEEMHLYPKEETSVVSCRSCCIRYSTPEEARLATHLTNTVFIDRTITVGHPRFETIASERQVSYSELMSPEVHRQDSRGESPRSDPAMQDEIRRTIYVGNLAHETTAEQVMKFFVGCGEIKFVRMAGDQSQASRFAFLEFTDPNSITQAIQMNGAIFGDRPLKVNHSKKAIVKPNNALLRLDPYSKESEALRRVQEASRFISEVVGTNEEHRSSRSKSREYRRPGYSSRRYTRSPDSRRERYQSRSRSPDEFRERQYSKSSNHEYSEKADKHRSSERKNGHHHSREETKTSKRSHSHKEGRSQHSESHSRRKDSERRSHVHVKSSTYSDESPPKHKSKSKHSKKHKHHHDHEEHSSSSRKKSRRYEPDSDMEY